METHWNGTDAEIVLISEWFSRSGQAEGLHP